MCGQLRTSLKVTSSSAQRGGTSRKNLSSIEFLKFLVVGGFNFIFTLIAFYVCVKVVKVNYLVSLVAVSAVGILITYSLNYIFVFLPDQKLEFRARVAKYGFASGVSIALNVICLHYLVQHTELDPFYAQMLLVPFIVIFNFTTAKFWSLRP